MRLTRSGSAGNRINPKRLIWTTTQGIITFSAAQAIWFSLLTSLAAELTLWNFDNDTAGWQPRAKSIVLKREDSARAGSQGSLRIQGRIDEGWNYALSERRPMSPDQFYRLSVWMRVDKIGTDTPMPYLKCEFVGSDPQRNLGQIHTDHYDGRQLEVWQQLSGEFRDDHAQWLAQQVDDANVSSPGAPWLNLVWFDPTVRAKPPQSLPTLRHFDDMDIVSARSDWSGNESLVVFIGSNDRRRHRSLSA